MNSRPHTACLALLCGLLTVSTVALAQTAQHAPITSRAELNRYLKKTPARSSPLDWLSPGGRKRFLARLDFGKHGLGGFSTDDPEHELTHAQIVQLFALFGVKKKYAKGLGLTRQEHARFERERRADAKARGCPVDSCPESAIEQRYDKLVLHPRDPSASSTQHFVRTSQRYDHLFDAYQTQQKLHSVDDVDLRLLKRAAVNYAVFYAPSSRHIAQLHMDLAEMQRRGIASPKDFTALYRAWVASRHFAKAAALARRHPGMDVDRLPKLRKRDPLPPGEPTALTVSRNGHTMTRQAFDLSTPLRIVVVASCHFSKDAARAIKADARLRALFARHAVWLAAQNDSFSAARQWNREFPKQPIHIAWKDSEWRKLDDWVMPTFYIFRHGKLVDKWSGWLADTGMKTLRRHLRGDDLL